MSKVTFASNEYENLTNKLLVASPFAMEGKLFHNSLIYVAKHSPEGSLGFIINDFIKDASVDDIFNEELGEHGMKPCNVKAHIGGPVSPERGFFVHTNEYKKNLMFSDNANNIAVSSNKFILEDVRNGIGPEKYIFVVGCTGWVAGQLEKEVERNLWLVADPSSDIIFDEVVYNKWNKVIARLGILPTEFIPLDVIC